MSVVKSFLLGLGGAAVVASGVAGTTSTASAQTVAAGVGAATATGLRTTGGPSIFLPGSHATA
jgi:hypothetical protein